MFKFFALTLLCKEQFIQCECCNRDIIKYNEKMCDDDDNNCFSNQKNYQCWVILK